MAVGDWLNVPLCIWRDHELLRIDIALLVVVLTGALWYGLLYGLVCAGIIFVIIAVRNS